MIPKGKVGLAGEAGPESIGGQMLDGPTLVSGGEKGTRVRREKPTISAKDLAGQSDEQIF